MIYLNVVVRGERKIYFLYLLDVKIITCHQTKGEFDADQYMK